MGWSNPATGGPHSAAHVRPPRLGLFVGPEKMEQSGDYQEICVNCAIVYQQKQ